MYFNILSRLEVGDECDEQTDGQTDRISQLPNLCTGIRTIDLLANTH